jgi:phospholipase C
MKVFRLCNALLTLGVCVTTAAMAAGTAVGRQAPSTTGVQLSSAPTRPVANPTKPVKRNARKFRPNTPPPIQHIVVLVQENRSLNDIFNGYSVNGYSTQTTTLGPGSVPLTPLPMVSPPSSDTDPKHGYLSAYLNEMQGIWSQNTNGLAYVPSTDLNDTILWNLAKNWELAGNLLQTNGGPSFIAHQFLIAGQSGAGALGSLNPYEIVENPTVGRVPINGIYETGGCDVTTYHGDTIHDDSIIPSTQFFPTNYNGNINNPVKPTCNDYPTILNRVQGSTPYLCNLGPGLPTNLQWKFYTPQQTLIWSAPIGVSHLYSTITHCTTGFTVDPTGQQLYNDVNGINGGFLAPLSFVIPCADWSDHPKLWPGTGPTGPQWVSWVADLIGRSSYWNTTTILVVWDDWGGWYDRIPAPIGIHNPNPYTANRDTYEYGFRVPLLVISPYISTPGSVDNSGPQIGPVLRTQASILRYIETTFGLSDLGVADKYSDDLLGTYTSGVGNMFNRQAPLSYTPTSVPASTFPAPCGASLDEDNT